MYGIFITLCTFSQGRWIAGITSQGPEKIFTGFHWCIFGVKENVRAWFSSKGGEVARARIMVSGMDDRSSNDDVFSVAKV
ncbi:hypothetical protein ACFX13_008574 [Malus domestica]